MPLTQEQLEQFPESIREWDEVKNSDSIEVVWDRFANMRSKLGTAIFAPGEDAGKDSLLGFDTKAVELSNGRLMTRPDLEDPEQRDALFNQLGRPDDPSGYEFEEIENAPLDGERKEFITGLAHKVGLTKTQLKELDKEIRTADAQKAFEQQEKIKSNLSELRQEWGLAFEDRSHLAKKVAKAYFPHIPEGTKFTAGELKSFYAIGKGLEGGGAEFRSQEHQIMDGNSPAEARDKINEIRNNPEHPYFDSNKPGHAEARAKMRELYKQANP